MKKVIPFMLLLAGCMASSREIRLPSGGKAFEVDCGGDILSWSSCKSKATALCPNDYYVIDKVDKDLGHWGAGGYYADDVRQITVVCR
jgi:hypothetical protein